MQNFITLLLILSPLFIGFILPTSDRWVAISEKCLSYLVYVILMLIGIELSQVQGLGGQIPLISLNVLILMVLNIGFGLIALILFDYLFPWHDKKSSIQEKHPISIRGSLIQVAFVIIGFLLGKWLMDIWLPPKDSITVLLMLLIFFVGVGLKGSGIALKEVLLNKRGVQVSVIFSLSVLFSGVIYALLMPDVSIFKGLALSSGFGWYSLSAIVMTDAYGAIWGSVALFNDLAREFFALLFIPFIMRHAPSAAVGVGGATSLDFTLPIIQQSGGMKVVPLAISFGFIINIISPILMVIFSSMG